MPHPFDSLYSHGFVRAAVCIPSVRVADPAYNAERDAGASRGRAAQAARRRGAVPRAGPLGLLAATTCSTRTRCSTRPRRRSARSSRRAATLTPVLLVGAPLRFEGKLFNCAVVIHRGRILGVVPKTYLPNYREFYEKRQFTVGARRASRARCGFSARVPFGNDLIFEADELPLLRAARRDLRGRLDADPAVSTYAALAGATVLVNLSASNITIGKAEYRRDLCAAQSARCVAAYLYSAAGPGESTTDLAWDGQALIYENGDLLAESERFADDDAAHHRRHRPRAPARRSGCARPASATAVARSPRARCARFRRVAFELEVPERRRSPLRRSVRALPLRAARPAAARRALLRGLQHPGAGADEAARRDRASSKS